MHDFTCYMEDVFTLELYIHLPKWKQRIGDVKSNLGTVLSNWGNPVESNIWQAFIIPYSCLQTYWCLQLVWCFRIDFITLHCCQWIFSPTLSPRICGDVGWYWTVLYYRKQRRKGKGLHQDVVVGSQLKSSWLLEPIEIITSSQFKVQSRKSSNQLSLLTNKQRLIPSFVIWMLDGKDAVIAWGFLQLNVFPCFSVFSICSLKLESFSLTANVMFPRAHLWNLLKDLYFSGLAFWDLQIPCNGCHFGTKSTHAFHSFPDDWAV